MLKSFTAALILGLSAQTASAECRFTMQFAYGSAELSVFDRTLLHDLARMYPNGPVSLTAHADDDGTGTQNARLAQARADTVLARMHRSGLRHEAVGRVALPAEKWDVVPTHASSVLNRRVEVFIEKCDPRHHPEARIAHTPGARFRDNGRIRLTSPKPQQN